MSADSPVVLVHGITASTDWWRPTVAALEPDHDVHVVRLPGFRYREAASWLGEWQEEHGLAGAAACHRRAQARDEFERASRAWEQHKSEANGHAEDRWEPPGAGPRATPGAGPERKPCGAASPLAAASAPRAGAPDPLASSDRRLKPSLSRLSA